MLEAHALKAADEPSTVEAVKGFREVEDDHGAGLADGCGVVDFLHVTDDIVACPAAREICCLCAVHHAGEGFGDAAGNSFGCYLDVCVEEGDGSVVGKFCTTSLAFIDHGDGAKRLACCECWGAVIADSKSLIEGVAERLAELIPESGIQLIRNAVTARCFSSRESS